MLWHKKKHRNLSMWQASRQNNSTSDTIASKNSEWHTVCSNNADGLPQTSRHKPKTNKNNKQKKQYNYGKNYWN